MKLWPKLRPSWVTTAHWNMYLPERKPTSLCTTARRMILSLLGMAMAVLQSIPSAAPRSWRISHSWWIARMIFPARPSRWVRILCWTASTGRPSAQRKAPSKGRSRLWGTIPFPTCPTTCSAWWRAARSNLWPSAAAKVGWWASWSPARWRTACPRLRWIAAMKMPQSADWWAWPKPMRRCPAAITTTLIASTCLLWAAAARWPTASIWRRLLPLIRKALPMTSAHVQRRSSSWAVWRMNWGDLLTFGCMIRLIRQKRCRSWDAVPGQWRWQTS